MESLVALGVACNVLQLIGTGLKVIQVAKELHDRGTTAQHEQASHQGAQMMQISQQLDERLSGISKTAHLTKQQLELKAVALSCQDIATRLYHKTGGSQAKHQKRSWRKALSKSIKLNFTKTSIDDMKEQLEQHNQLLQTRLLAELHIQQEAAALQQSSGFLQLEQGFRDLVTDLASRDAAVSAALNTVGADVSQKVQFEGLETRRAVGSAIEKAGLREDTRQQRDRLLRSLRFDRINERMNSVPESHKKTLDWIFDRTALQRWDSFVEWLETGESVYWVSGKPASGKSVLMKFIISNEKTREHLKVWSGDSPLFLFNFFIWKGGNKMQRSEHGLLCSILDQMLRESELFMMRIVSMPQYAVKQEATDWSTKELRMLMSQFSQLQDSKICLLIDGLDESDPTDGDVGMVRLVHWLHALPNTKVCVASRAEPELRAAFIKSPHITLEQLNREDMQKYVTDRLLEVSRQAAFQGEDSESVPSRLTELVLSKADGVFLWVRLAVSAVSRGLHRMDGWDEISRRLEGLPTELEMLYVDLLQRHEADSKHYQTEAAFYFHLAITTQEKPLSCFDIAVSQSESAQVLLNVNDAEVAPATLLQECERLERRVSICCMGLLEWRTEDINSIYLRPYLTPKKPATSDEIAAELSYFRRRYMRFLHRTVVDFLNSPDVVHSLAMNHDKFLVDTEKMRYEALLVAPYYEFPIIDFYRFGHALGSTYGSVTYNSEQIRYAHVVEAIQSRLKSRKLLPQKSDICRNFVDRLFLDKTLGGFSIDGFGCGFYAGQLDLRPAMYAVGWTSFLASAAFVSYFEQLFGQADKSLLRVQYVSCLAWCVSGGFWTIENQKISRTHKARFESSQLHLLNILTSAGADLHIRFPKALGLTYCVDAWSQFFDFRRVFRCYTSEETRLLLSGLKALLMRVADPNATHLLRVSPWVSSYDGDESIGFDLREFPVDDNLKFENRIAETSCFMEVNFAAQLSTYLKLIKAPSREISQILTPFGQPRCVLLSVVDNLGESMRENMRVRRPTSSQDSILLYDTFSRYIESASAWTGDTDMLSDIRQGMYDMLAEAIKTIYERGTDMTGADLQDLKNYVVSNGHFTPRPVRCQDIPYLQLFDTEEKDCSSFMFPQPLHPV